MRADRMMKAALVAVAGTTLIGAAQLATPQATAPSTTPMPAAPARPSGYLGDRAPDTYAVLPPAPKPGSARWEADRAIFLATRKLQDTPRWKLAQADVDLSNATRGLSCAIGVSLTPQTAPKTYALAAKVGPDVSRATNRPKDIYKRPRPYLTDEGPICVPKDPALAASPDYPSGHVTWGWTIGLIMAEAAPDRATQILARARAFGESRLICGVHTMTAVESGRTNASILVAALNADETFRKDLEGVRQELAELRAKGPAPDPAACAAEADLVAQSPY